MNCFVRVPLIPSPFHPSRFGSRVSPRFERLPEWAPGLVLAPSWDCGVGGVFLARLLGGDEIYAAVFPDCGLGVFVSYFFQGGILNRRVPGSKERIWRAEIPGGGQPRMDGTDRESYNNDRRIQMVAVRRVVRR
jgi:hypothetical protein